MKSTGDYTAIVNAHIYVSSSEEITKGSILIKDGRVLKSARKSKFQRLTNYRFDGKNGVAAFVELNSNIGVAAKKEVIDGMGLK